MPKDTTSVVLLSGLTFNGRLVTESSHKIAPAKKKVIGS